MTSITGEYPPKIESYLRTDKTSSTPVSSNDQQEPHASSSAEAALRNVANFLSRHAPREGKKVLEQENSQARFAEGAAFKRA